MADSNFAQQIERLREEIRRHDRLYYVDTRPEISDLEYDRLMQQLQMLEAATNGIKERGKATRGEKTMLDALVPACEAFANGIKAQKSLVECLSLTCKAAKEGVEYTKTIIATKGRASYLGERSLGHQDPGATSSYIMLEALADFCRHNNLEVN